MVLLWFCCGYDAIISGLFQTNHFNTAYHSKAESIVKKRCTETLQDQSLLCYPCVYTFSLFICLFYLYSLQEYCRPRRHSLSIDFINQHEPSEGFTSYFLDFHELKGSESYKKHARRRRAETADLKILPNYT